MNLGVECPIALGSPSSARGCRGAAVGAKGTAQERLGLARDWQWLGSERASELPADK